jgi:hypothetical protein
MRDISEVLKETEMKLEVVRREVEALRLVAPLLSDESDRLNVSHSDEIAWKDASTGQPVKAWP